MALPVTRRSLPSASVLILMIAWVNLVNVGHRFAMLLLVLVGSLGEMLLSQPSLTIVHRPFVSFPQEAVIGEVFNTLTPESCRTTLKRLFSHNFFILPSMLQTWEAALGAFVDKKWVNTLHACIYVASQALRLLQLWCLSLSSPAFSRARAKESLCKCEQVSRKSSHC